MKKKSKREVRSEFQSDAGVGIKFIDLKLDYSFKRVFGTEGNEDLLLLLVNYILPEKHIRSVVLGPQEQKGDYEEARDCVFDVYCTTDDGSKLVIEIQLNDKNDFARRMVYYSGFPIRNQVKAGEGFYNYNDVYVIGILDFLLPGHMTMVASPINSFTYRNDSDTSIQLTTCSTLVTVELPKFRKSLSELESVGDKMMYCFRYQSTFNSIPKELQCPELEKLFGISNFASLTENEQNMYMREFKEKMDRLSELHTAECKGLEKGLEKGRAEGRAEANLQMAKDMKQKNLPVSLISELTHLSVEEIERL